MRAKLLTPATSSIRVAIARADFMAVDGGAPLHEAIASAARKIREDFSRIGHYSSGLFSRRDQMSITPCLWFDHQAEEAARFYVSIFKNSKVGAITRYPKNTPGPEGSVMTVTFTLDGQEFLALNGGPIYKFTPAVSLIVNCKTQKEIDRMWARLSEGGQEVECAWLTDKYGLSWQVVPVGLMKMITKSPAPCDRDMHEVLKMKKLDLKTLEKAAASKS